MVPGPGTGEKQKQKTGRIGPGLQGPVEYLGHRCLTGTAALSPPEERLPAERAVIAVALRACPLHTALLITELCGLLPPDGYRALHHPDTCGDTEIFYQAARPIAALMAGVDSLGPHAVTDGAESADPVEHPGRVGLHAPET